MTKKSLVLYSGGLDSRLVVNLMQDEGYDVTALHFNLPFGCGCCDLGCNFKFTQMSGVELVVKDVCCGDLLKEYLALVKNPQHGTGKGINPCRDCKIFMFRKAKEFADERGIEVIATGEVLGQRPMSQTRHATDIIDKRIGFDVRRPLTEMGIVGRGRSKQRELAEKFGIDYPNPAGGCLLCEKALVRRFKILLEKDLISEETLPLVSVGRHYFIGGIWMVVGKNEKDNDVIERFGNSLEGGVGFGAVYFHSECGKEKAEELQKDYKRFEEFKL